MYCLGSYQQSPAMVPNESKIAMAQAHGLIAILFAPPDEQPPSLWRNGQRPAATLAGVLAVHVRYLAPDDRAPLGFCRLPD